MTTPAPTPVRTAAVTIALIVGSILLLLAVLGAIPNVASHFTGNWNGDADFSTPDVPFSETGLTTKDAGPAYSGVRISSPEPLVAPRVLQAGATALNGLTAILGSLLIVVLAIRLLMRRSFTRLARWGLVVLGVVVMLTAAIAPQFEVLSVDLAVQELGYPVASNDDGGPTTADSPDVISPGLWGVWALNRVDMTLFLLGGMLALLGFLVADGVRLQRETEGLV